MDTYILFICSLVGGDLGCFYFSAIGINTAMNMCTSFCVTLWGYTLRSLRIYCGVGLLGHMVTLPPAKHEGSSFLILTNTCFPSS